MPTPRPSRFLPTAALLTAFVCASSAAAQTAAPAPAPVAVPRADTLIPSADLRADAAILRRAWETLHPGLLRYNTEADIDAAFENLDRAFSRDRTLADAFLEFSKVAARVRCGHTYPNFFNQKKAVQAALFKGPYLPFHFRWLGDRMVVTRSFAAGAALAPGTEVLSINGTPVDEILSKLMTVARADGHNDAKRVAYLQLDGSSRYEAFDVFWPLFYPSQEPLITLRVKPLGASSPITLKLAPAATADRTAGEPAPRTVAAADTNPVGWELKTLDPGLALLKMPDWALFNTKWDWKAWLQEAFTGLEKSGIANLVIDLRGNEGGSDVGDVIVSHLVTKPAQRQAVERRVRYRKVPDALNPWLDTWDDSFRDWGAAATPRDARFFRLRRDADDDVAAPIAPAAPRFAGRVFVIVGATNSSATFEFAQTMRQNGLGTLVGQPTGGNQRGINGGTFFFLRLPKSGLEIDLPLIGQFPLDEKPDAGIEPDVLVTPTPGDIASGRDVELDAVRRLIRETPRSETTTYVIHHIERPIGEERDVITRGADGVALTSTLDYTDRGGRIQMESSLRVDARLTPLHFAAHGKTYRFVNVDADIEIRDNAARVTLSGKTSTVTPPANFFTARGYAPLAARALLVERWEKLGRPREIPLLPDGNVARITYRGEDTIATKAGPLKLRRYEVEGVVWGREAVWLDEANRLVALFTRIHILPLEAVRSDLVDALPALQASALRDRMTDLATMGRELKPVADGAFAFVGARVWTGTAAPPIDDATILVRDGRIVAVGPRAEVALPKGVRTIDARGRTIVPGLWDLHAHTGQIEWAPAYLAAGVTTARDVGGERRFLTALRDALASGSGPGPRLLLAGLVEGGGPNGYGTTIATTPEEARAIVDAYKAAGFQQMKLYNQLTPEVATAVIAQAHALGMTVTGHIPNAMTLRSAVEAGLDQFEHLAVRGTPGSPEVAETIRFLKEKGTVAGLTMAWDELLGRAPETAIESFEPGILIAPIPLQSSYGSVRNETDAAKAQTSLRRSLDIVGALHKGGVRIVAGTDGAVPGVSLIRTLELFVQAGLAPKEALATATRVPAEFLGLGADVGTLEAGKRADLLIVDADPLANISNLRKSRFVVTNGRAYATADLARAAGFRP